MQGIVERDTTGPSVTRDREPNGRRRRGRWLPAACLVAIAVYAVFALVVFPDGDPSPLSRGVALLVVAGVGAAAIAVARWAPTWARGLGLLLVGFAMVSVLAGVVAGRLTRDPSVGALVGLVAGLGGVSLIVAGWARLLHRARRRWVRIVTAAVATLLVLQFLVLPGVVALTVTNRARPEGSGRTPADVGLSFEEVRLPTSDGAELAAWWVPAENGAAVIVLPGSGSTRDDALEHAAMLVEAGYGTLVMDPRGHGASGGRLMDFGWGAERDVRQAVTSVLERPEITEGVGVLGLSMGGEVALTAAALDPRIGAVVAEGATARTWDDVRAEPAPHPVGIANEWVTFGLVDLLAPEEPPVPLLEAVRRIDVPVLLIEGNGPKEATLGPVYAEANPDDVTLWTLPDTPHISAIRVHRAAYEERVLTAFEALLPGV